MDTSKDNLHPLNIDLAIKFAEFFVFSFYIKKKNEEFIEIFHKTTGLNNTFRGYKERGLTEIYLKPEHYDVIVSKLKGVLKQVKNYKEAFSDIDKIFSTVHAHVRKYGFNRYTLDHCSEINTLVIQQLNSIPRIAELIIEVKQNNNKLFYQYVFKSYVAICMLETFDWHSDVLKNKIGQACLLMDINLSDNDLIFMRDNPKDIWPAYVFNHPSINAASIKEASSKIPLQVLQIIELHHEVPGELGYPRGVDSQNIPALASLVIVAELFTDKIFNSNFKPEDTGDLLELFDTLFSKGIFRSSLASLILAINKK